VTVRDPQAFSPHRLAIDLMRSLVQGDTENARGILEDDRYDISGLCALMARRRMAGYIHTLVERTALTKSVPPEANQILVESYRQQLQRSESSLKLLTDVREKMREASIPFLTLKGLYLAQRFFGDIRRRFMWDLDILVHKSNLNASISAIEQTGLKIQPGAHFGDKNSYWGIHAIEARGDAGKVDIHHAIRNLPGMHFDHDLMWDGAQEFTIGQASFATLCDEDTLLAATVGMGADLQSGHHRLRKIWDIYVMLLAMDSATDWGEFFARREREGSLKLVINILSFCMLLVRAKGDFPNLCQAMSAHGHLLMIKDEQQADVIYSRPRQHLANRVLFSRLLPTSPLNYWLNWLITLPVRTWHFR
jgi:hypothetical protein